MVQPSSGIPAARRDPTEGITLMASADTAFLGTQIDLALVTLRLKLPANRPCGDPFNFWDEKVLAGASYMYACDRSCLGRLIPLQS